MVGMTSIQHLPPYPPHPRPALQNTLLRDLLRERGLSSSGTREVLLSRVAEALEREAVAAFGGRKQLATYAHEAVSARVVGWVGGGPVSGWWGGAGCGGAGFDVVGRGGVLGQRRGGGPVQRGAVWCSIGEANSVKGCA